MLVLSTSSKKIQSHHEITSPALKCSHVECVSKEEERLENAEAGAKD